MKLYKISLFLMVVLLTFSCGTTTEITKSWTSPNAAKTQIKGKIVVLVKIDDYTLRRNFEDKITQEFKNDGIDAISAYNHFTEEDLNNEKSLMLKIEQLEIGAALTIFPISNKTKNNYAPTVSARVGVPVDFGLGPIFLGASVPVAGGSYSETIANLEILFYIKDKNDAIYSSTISGVSDDADYLIKTTSELLMIDLKKKNILN